MKKEKTHFTVKLTELKAEDKVKLIKEVKNCIQGLNLVQVAILARMFEREREFSEEAAWSNFVPVFSVNIIGY